MGIGIDRILSYRSRAGVERLSEKQEITK